jgi:hypothetical protein
MKNDSFGRIIAGPVGSGKTIGCMFELLRRACEQAPGDDGLRYTRFAIVRQTLKQLKDTVLKDITGWLEGMVKYKVTDSTIYIEIGDVRSEWILIPLDTPEDQRRLLSMQLTASWMSEAIEMNIDLVSAISGRMPRYPSAKLGTASWFGIIADTNMPTEGSDWHKFMTDPPPDWRIFIQPGGLDPLAENLAHLNQTPETKRLDEDDPIRLAQGRKYYERNSRNPNVDWVTRYVNAQYGPDPSGTPVFRQSFKMSFHVADEVDPIHGHPLIIGQDFGRDPWSVVTQLDHRGRLLVLGELEADGVGLELHINRSLRPALVDPRYLGKAFCIVGDPSGKAKSTIYEETTFETIKRLGFMAFPAPTNDIDPRLRAVEAFLLAQRDGGPAMLISKKHCPTIVRAMASGYRYARTRSGNTKPLPDKNEFSHVMDALQYACLVAQGGMVGFINNKMRVGPRRIRSTKVSAAGWC